MFFFPVHFIPVRTARILGDDNKSQELLSYFSSINVSMEKSRFNYKFLFRGILCVGEAAAVMAWGSNRVLLLSSCLEIMKACIKHDWKKENNKSNTDGKRHLLKI